MIVVTDYLSLLEQFNKLEAGQKLSYNGFTVEKFEDMYLISDQYQNFRTTLLSADTVLDYITLEKSGEEL